MFIRYTVKSGDTLSSIVKEFLGDTNRLNTIFMQTAPTEQERRMENAKG